MENYLAKKDLIEKGREILNNITITCSKFTARTDGSDLLDANITIKYNDKSFNDDVIFSCSRAEYDKYDVISEYITYSIIDADIYDIKSFVTLFNGEELLALIKFYMDQKDFKRILYYGMEPYIVPIVPQYD